MSQLYVGTPTLPRLTRATLGLWGTSRDVLAGQRVGVSAVDTPRVRRTWLMVVCLKLLARQSHLMRDRLTEGTRSRGVALTDIDTTLDEPRRAPPAPAPPCECSPQPGRRRLRRRRSIEVPSGTTEHAQKGSQRDEGTSSEASSSTPSPPSRHRLTHPGGTSRVYVGTPTLPRPSRDLSPESTWLAHQRPR